MPSTTCGICGVTVAAGQDVTHGNWHQFTGETIRQLRLLADSARSAADAATVQLAEARGEINRLLTALPPKEPSAAGDQRPGDLRCPWCGGGTFTLQLGGQHSGLVVCDNPDCDWAS